MILRTAPRDATCALAMMLLFAGGCYSGEWRTGIEVPVSTQSRLQPTRDVERWELEPTVTPYVVRLGAELTPRCRNARFGSSKRVDTGRFKREGGQYWRGVAIGSVVLGGVATALGGSAWISRDTGNGLPAMYAVGGLLSAGGIINCALALKQGGVTRWALCSSFMGLGLSTIAGAALQQTVLPKPMMPGQPLSPDIDRALTFSGIAALGVAVVTGIVAAKWHGQVDRTRVIEKPQDSLWDRRQGETTCGPARPLVGRTATLDIVAEHVTEGPGSEADPLHLRVAVGDEGRTVVDLRSLRQALASCGVLRLQLNPDTLYEKFAEDYIPPQSPQLSLPAGRPIHGQIVPREGFTMHPPEAKHHSGGHISVPGLADELMSSVERRCRGEVAREQPVPPRNEGPRTVPVTPAGPVGVSGPPAPTGPTGIEPRAALPECSAEARKTLLDDCDHSCSKSLEVGTCLFDRRKCLIDARYSQQKQRDEDLCDLAWEKCIFKAGVGPAAWNRCTESCLRKNEPPVCREPQ